MRIKRNFNEPPATPSTSRLPTGGFSGGNRKVAATVKNPPSGAPGESQIRRGGYRGEGREATGGVLHPNSPARKAAYLGVLSALALALSWAEQFVAPLLRLPLGAKPGLSNIAVMMGAALLGWPAGLAVAVVKALFAGITRGPTALLLSGAGGILSAFLVGILLQACNHSAKRGGPPQVGELGIGILGGVTHNMAQLFCAAMLMRSTGVFWAAPGLLLFGLLAGAATGTMVRLLRKVNFKL